MGTNGVEEVECARSTSSFDSRRRSCGLQDQFGWKDENQSEKLKGSKEGEKESESKSSKW